jgi:hypothetical protein
VGSSPGESGLCTLETKHDGTTSRPELFSTGKLQEQRPQLQKSILGLSYSEDVSGTWKLSIIEEWNQAQDGLFQQGDYKNRGGKPRNSCVLVSVKIFALYMLETYDGRRR